MKKIFVFFLVMISFVLCSCELELETDGSGLVLDDLNAMVETSDISMLEYGKKDGLHGTITSTMTEFSKVKEILASLKFSSMEHSKIEQSVDKETFQEMQSKVLADGFTSVQMCVMYNNSKNQVALQFLYNENTECDYDVMNVQITSLSDSQSKSYLCLLEKDENFTYNKLYTILFSIQA